MWNICIRRTIPIEEWRLSSRRFLRAKGFVRKQGRVEKQSTWYKDMKRKSLSKPPLPREHGAWGILFGAFLSAVAFTKTLLPAQALLLLSFIFFYLARHVFLGFRRATGDASARIWLVIFGASGLICLGLSARLQAFPQIIIFSAVLAAFFLAELLLIRRRKQMSFLAQFIGTVALTAIAPLTIILQQTRITGQAAFLWLLNIVFFSSGLLYVRYQILLKANISKQREQHRYQRALIWYHASLLLFPICLSILSHNYRALVVVFLPSVFQGFYSVATRKQIESLKRVGWLQIGQTIAFVLLLALVF